MTPEQKFQQLFEELYQLCEEQGWGDPFSYSRAKEIHLAITLGHKVSSTYSGADAYELICGNEKAVEYKTTIGNKINATYNGISVQDTWEKQEEYLVQEKLGKYHHHYIARYNKEKIEEVWKFNSDEVLMILFPKLKDDWKRKTNGKHKDPRLSATITSGEIHKYGIQVR